MRVRIGHRSSLRILRNWVGAVGILILFAAVASTTSFLFRKVTVDNTNLGLISYRYHWGRLHEIAVDANRDGAWDAISRIESGDNKAQSTDFQVLEGWESTELDGRYDVHYWRDKASGKLVLEYDSNNDGVYDSRLHGGAATAFLKSHVPTTLGIE